MADGVASRSEMNTGDLNPVDLKHYYEGIEIQVGTRTFRLEDLRKVEGTAGTVNRIFNDIFSKLTEEHQREGVEFVRETPDNVTQKTLKSGEETSLSEEDPLTKLIHALHPIALKAFNMKETPVSSGSGSVPAGSPGGSPTAPDRLHVDTSVSSPIVSEAGSSVHSDFSSPSTSPREETSPPERLELGEIQDTNDVFRMMDAGVSNPEDNNRKIFSHIQAQEVSYGTTRMRVENLRNRDGTSEYFPTPHPTAAGGFLASEEAKLRTQRTSSEKDFNREFNEALINSAKRYHERISKRPQMAANSIEATNWSEEMGNKSLLVSAHAGCGKSTALDDFSSMVHSGRIEKFQGYTVIPIDNTVKGIMNQWSGGVALAGGILRDIASKADGKVIFAVDEAHQLIAGTSSGEKSSLIETLKTEIENGDVRLIGLTDRPKEFYCPDGKTEDKAIKDRFPQRHLGTPPMSSVVDILHKSIFVSGNEKYACLREALPKGKEKEYLFAIATLSKKVSQGGFPRSAHKALSLINSKLLRQKNLQASELSPVLSLEGPRLNTDRNGRIIVDGNGRSCMSIHGILCQAMYDNKTAASPAAALSALKSESFDREYSYFQTKQLMTQTIEEELEGEFPLENGLPDPDRLDAARARLLNTTAGVGKKLRETATGDLARLFENTDLRDAMMEKLVDCFISAHVNAIELYDLDDPETRSPPTNPRREVVAPHSPIGSSSEAEGNLVDSDSGLRETSVSPPTSGLSETHASPTHPVVTESAASSVREKRDLSSDFLALLLNITEKLQNLEISELEERLSQIRNIAKRNHPPPPIDNEEKADFENRYGWCEFMTSSEERTRLLGDQKDEEFRAIEQQSLESYERDERSQSDAFNSTLREAGRSLSPEQSNLIIPFYHIVRSILMREDAPNKMETKQLLVKLGVIES